ncbi:MAG: phosphatidylcholine/phosphatidylserine synthase [Gammaproteobacteria bacterium AqS3]|nr:phosphatidylcholine/phosphatidylserine synthase [Gammaproteobacteria bacterium AqS3]
MSTESDRSEHEAAPEAPETAAAPPKRVGGRLRGGVHLLPNILTTGTLFSGFYTITASIQGNFLPAAFAIFFAMAFDATDGRVARWTHTQSEFGQEYDSLSDLVAFGIAPAVMMFTWGLSQLGDWGWLLAAFYVLSTSLRLARFNLGDSSEWPGHYFQGLPSPAAAGLMATTIWAMNSTGFDLGEAFATAITGLLLALSSVAMMSRFPYLSFKGFDVKDKVPIKGLLWTAFGISCLIVLPASILMLLAIIYLFSGPVMWLMGIGREPKAGAAEGSADGDGKDDQLFN